MAEEDNDQLEDNPEKQEDETPSGNDTEERPDRLKRLISTNRASIQLQEQATEDGDDVEKGKHVVFDTPAESLTNGLGIQNTEERPTAQFGRTLADVHKRMSQYTEGLSNKRLVQVRMENVSYHVPVPTDRPHIPTVKNANIFYDTYSFFKRIRDYCRSKRKGGEIFTPYTQTAILKDISLCFRPGNTYLVLGPPGCGKTTLLKAISGRLRHKDASFQKDAADKPHISGKIKFNGITTDDEPSLIMPSIASYVGQIDIHAPLLTVKETFEFAFQCCTGGDHNNAGVEDSAEAAKMNEEKFTENLTIEGLDLAHVSGTFVGNDSVRGVSGGQRRRVTIGEMMMSNNPVACADEISTGLDAAATCDIVRSIVTFAKAAMTTRIVALLQPGPETFSQFDEVIVLAEGRVIFAGPIDDVVEYFADLGYILPATMDVADFLQLVPTEDGAAFFEPEKSKHGATEHYTPERFAQAFQDSGFGQDIRDDLASPHPYAWTSSESGSFLKKVSEKVGKVFTKESENDEESQEKSQAVCYVPDEFKTKYQNSSWRSMVLNFNRYITLWTRDKGYIIGKICENIGMASAAGGILYDKAAVPNFSDPNNWTNNAADVDLAYEMMFAIYGAFYLTLWHLSQGTMINASDELDVRSINYKHIDANFYQAPSMIIGRTMSTLPQRSLEIFAFGIPVYFLLNLNRTASSFFIFLGVIFAFTLALNVSFSILSNLLPSKAYVQGIGTFFLLLMTQFGGYIVFPDALPDWVLWIYWINPFGWGMQALVANEFQTGRKYDDINPGGTFFVTATGFKTGGGRIGYAFAFLLPFSLVCIWILAYVLKYVRHEGNKGKTVKDQDITEEEIRESINKASQSIVTELPFTPVDLTFKDISYEVKAHTTGETLRILKNVNGFMKAGRMCALVGSSGAGKTTLMDVISLRKTSGTIEGEVHLNGFSQERISFLRCAAYVEQFDIQSPELTVRETVMFSANLRLDPSIEATADKEGKERFVDGVLEMLELTVLKNSQVGSFEAGGLTFEQRKRLAIAVEFAGSPSILFLDEPTSGLDARGALVVMRAMKRIADTGRTVCATIHQPSSAVFEMFDDILLLKTGGQVVYFGELGEGSIHLIDYFESRGARPIEHGENPASWMLRAPVKEKDGVVVDWAELYTSSDNYSAALNEIEALNESPDEAKKISYDKPFATSLRQRMRFMIKRVGTIYLRSPAYNVTRCIIAVVYAFIQGCIFLNHAYQPSSTSRWTENEATGLLGTIFLAKIIIGVSSISMVVPVMKQIRDVFYKHRASGMLSHSSLSMACLLAEIPYIILVSLLYCGVFFATTGIFQFEGRFGALFGFFALNVAIYSYWGQAFICLVKDLSTAGALQGALIGMNVFFSGYIVRPQFFFGFMKVGWYFAPGHFAYEGLVANLFVDNTNSILAYKPSAFYYYLIEKTSCNSDTACLGSFPQYVDFFFGGYYRTDHTGMDVGVLLAYLAAGRMLMWLALKYFNYVNT